MNTKISILVTLFSKNTNYEIIRCFESLASQSYKPDEVILVVDGPTNIDVCGIIKKYTELFLIKTYFLTDNIGLGLALNFGLKHCCCDYVARIDIDDVCKPHRLELQKTFLDLNTRISVLGGQINLFDDRGVYGIRNVPVSSRSINQHSLYRNPINHSTVIFRRNDIINLGGYPEIRFTQDYILWIKCINSGLIFYNLPDILCEMYADKKMIGRRGLSFLRYDLEPYFLNYKLKRNNIFILALMIFLRSSFNVLNSFKVVFNFHRASYEKGR